MLFEKRMTETQSFRSITLSTGRPYHLHPLHLLVYHCKSSHNLINYARAHNSLWLHTEVSSMNNLMIPLSLGGGPYTYRQHLVLQVSQSTQMWVLVATLSKPLLTISHLSWISLKNQSTSTSIAWQCKHNIIVTPKVWMQGNRFLPHQLLPNTHMLSILLMQCLRVETNA